MTKAEQARQEKKDAIERLHQILKPGDTVYTVLRSVSKSGMSRKLDVYAFLPYPERGPRAVEKYRLTGLVALATGYRYDRRADALHVQGCGFDAGHSVVYELAWALYGQEDALDALRHEWIR